MYFISLQLNAPFWSSLSLSGPSGDFKLDLPPTDRNFIFWNTQLLTFEAEEARRCLREGNSHFFKKIIVLFKNYFRSSSITQNLH